MKIEWNEKVKKMEEEGNLKKDIDNNHVGNIKYADLEYLKAQNGPFTRTEEVIEFDQNTLESKEKNKRLYTEVRHTKYSCLSMKHTATVFRLKRDYQDLPSKAYVENQYLGEVRSKTVLTADDLSELLVKLNQDQNPCVEKTRLNEEEQGDDNADDDNQDNEGNQKHKDYASDDHVAAVWMDEKENALSWYLGVIDSISPDNIDVIYYYHREKKGMCWNFPENDDGGIPLATPRDHIIYRGITVSYMQTSSVIRCALDKSTVMDIETAFETYVSNLAYVH